MDTVSVLMQSDDMMIEVEMQLEGHATFAKKYQIATGQPMAYDIEGVCLRKRESYTCRIYFNGDATICEQMQKEGFNVTFGDPNGPRGHWQPEFKYRIDSNALFWKLVWNGLRLGYWSKDAKLSLADRRKEHIQAVATRNFDAVNAEIERVEGEIAQHELYARSNRKAGFRELGREHASKASTMKQKLDRLKAQQAQIVSSV